MTDFDPDGVEPVADEALGGRHSDYPRRSV